MVDLVAPRRRGRTGIVAGCHIPRMGSVGRTKVAGNSLLLREWVRYIYAEKWRRGEGERSAPGVAATRG